MDKIFAASEAVELGVEIEINGRDFYQAVLSKSKSKEARDIFNYLKGEVEKHIKTFRRILSSVQKYEPKEAYPQEYFEYMNSLASEHVFTQKNKGKEIARQVKDEKEAMDLGIGFEKDSITFYEGIKRLVSAEDRKIIDVLINEEKKHLRRLTELKLVI